WRLRASRRIRGNLRARTLGGRYNGDGELSYGIATTSSSSALFVACAAIAGGKSNELSQTYRARVSFGGHSVRGCRVGLPDEAHRGARSAGTVATAFRGFPAQRPSPVVPG